MGASLKIMICLLSVLLCCNATGKFKLLEERKDDTLSGCPVEYVTGGIEASDGSVWVIGERSGIYRYWKGASGGKAAGAWMCADYYRDYPKTENFYGIAEDKQGRIWVGTDNQGVFVFNGVSWKQYDRENALPGERIFDINVSPVTGEVAIATSMGLVIYNPKDESWKTFTRGQGLYADQVGSLCFDHKGDLWLAYSCGGVGKGSPKDNYSRWDLVQAPWHRDSNQYVRQPQEAMGEGLPSNLCNIILAGSGNYVWVGTNDGIGLTSNGKTWKFVRGEDYWSKNKGVYGSIITGKQPSLGRKLLPEDYVTSMNLTSKGLWIGFREKGAVLAKPSSLEVMGKAIFPKELRSPWVTGFISLADGAVYAMTYGNGVFKIQNGKKGGGNKPAKRNVIGEIIHPKEAVIHGWAMLEKKGKEIQQLKASGKDESSAVFWKEDWATQGDWCQRYGTNLAILCGANFESSSEYFWAGFRSTANVGCRLGCNLAGKKGGVRSALGWLNKAEDTSVLFNPERGLRTYGVWMDATIGDGVDGSDLWLVVQVEKEGKYELSLYFYNAGIMGYPVLAKRDNLLEIRKFKSSYSDETSLNLFASETKDKDGKDPLEEETALILKEPVLARTRVKDISGGGVYKTFVLDSPGMYYVRLARNGSQGARLSGIFISKMYQEGLLGDSRKDGLFEQYSGIILSPSTNGKDLSAQEKSFVSLWDETNRMSTSPAMLSSSHEWSLDAYRNMKKNDSDSLIIPPMRWEQRLWNEEDKKQFEESLLKSWHAFQEKRKGPYITEEYSKESPRVLPISMRDVEIMEYLNMDWREYVFEEGKQGKPFGELRNRLDAVTDQELENLRKKSEEEQTNGLIEIK